MIEPTSQDIPIEDIVISKSRRPIESGKAENLRDSIRLVGLMHPIAVNDINGELRLISGNHRIQAYVMLGWVTIPAFIYEVDEDTAEAMEIVENLIRSPLAGIFRTKALARLKVIYEKKHLEAGHGKAAGKPPKGGKGDSVSSFAEDTARKTGKSARTIQREVAVGEALADGVAEALVDTPIADNVAELAKLGKLKPAKQKAAAKKLKAGTAKTVAEASKPKAAPTKAPKPAGKAAERKALKAIEAAIGKVVRWCDEVKLNPKKVTLQQILDKVEEKLK